MHKAEIEQAIEEVRDLHKSIRNVLDGHSILACVSVMHGWIIETYEKFPEHREPIKSAMNQVVNRINQLEAKEKVAQ